MQKDKVEIRIIRKDELSYIKDFAPPDWNLNLEEVYNEHYGRDYFYPIAALVNSEIAGTGIAIVNDNTAWLGNIVVKEGYRNQGIGCKITKSLVDHSLKQGVENILLVATELGLPVYKKAGFVTELYYLFFKTDKPVKIDYSDKFISPVSKNDHESVFNLDYSLSGEKREKILINYLSTGYKYKDNKIRGFYLPDFGSGLIIANNNDAGIELLKFKLSQNATSVSIPETNKTAIKFLISIGYNQFMKAPRMFLINNANWNPAAIYSRGCGYMG